MNSTSRENLTGHFTLWEAGEGELSLGKTQTSNFCNIQKKPMYTIPIMLYYNAAALTQKKYTLQYGAHNFHFVAIIRDNGEGNRSKSVIKIPSAMCAC